MLWIKRNECLSYLRPLGDAGPSPSALSPNTEGTLDFERSDGDCRTSFVGLVMIGSRSLPELRTPRDIVIADCSRLSASEAGLKEPFTVVEEDINGDDC